MPEALIALCNGFLQPAHPACSVCFALDRSSAVPAGSLDAPELAPASPPRRHRPRPQENLSISKRPAHPAASRWEHHPWKVLEQRYLSDQAPQVPGRTGIRKPGNLFRVIRSQMIHQQGSQQGRIMYSFFRFSAAADFTHLFDPQQSLCQIFSRRSGKTPLSLTPSDP